MALITLIPLSISRSSVYIMYSGFLKVDVYDGVYVSIFSQIHSLVLGILGFIHFQSCFGESHYFAELPDRS